MDAIGLAEIGALIGDPARACMLSALMAGRALTATELARHAGVSPQTASGHLARLARGGLLDVAQQGRHRYFRIADPAIAHMLEDVMEVSTRAPPRYRPRSKEDEALRVARTCYDHLAGQVGVAIADALCAQGHVVLAAEAAQVTEKGRAFLRTFGANTDDLSGRRLLCRVCVDWTERRPHFAGRVGAAIALRCYDLGWLRRSRGTRALTLTPAGRAGLRATFGLSL
jgi:DNA-binding transcriptional ArsR family regulator